MKLKQTTIEELGIILKEEFNLKLSKADLEKLAYALLGYFNILLKVTAREEVRK